MGRFANSIFRRFNKTRQPVARDPIEICGIPVADLTIEQLVEEHGKWHILHMDYTPADWLEIPNHLDAIQRSKEIVFESKTRHMEIINYLYKKYPNRKNLPAPWR